ncbi:hypothetical protein RB195_010885 [Necator americanus]|uniref:Uncharacterized protein n=1 Tax=Necator americanus TaxID=51031 RepID=A0ABR1CZW4_NECAM
MTSTLATRQGLLTHSGNRLSTIIQEESETINAYVHSSMEAAEISALRKRIRTAKTAISTEANKLDAAMEKFSEAVDRLDNKTQSLLEIIERIETNTTAAETLLDNANKALTRLIRLQEELEFDQEQISLNRCEVPEMKLAQIQNSVENSGNERSFGNLSTTPWIPETFTTSSSSTTFLTPSKETQKNL